MKIRKKIGNLGKDKLQQIVEAFISDLEQGAVAVLEYLEDVENPEFLELELDDEEKILSFTRKDGSHYIYNLSSETIDTLKGMIDDINESTGITTFETFDDPEDRLNIGKDSENKIFNYRKKDGTLVENVGIETPHIKTNHLELTEQGMNDFQQALKDSGFDPGGTGDWSDYISDDGDNPLCIPEPRCVLVNISGISEMPERKGLDLEAYFEMWDMSGNYFKKKAYLNAQGNGSLQFVRKNFAADLFDGDWGEDAFGVKIGNWVPQDSFHFKSFYNDYFRGVGNIAYKIADLVDKTYDFYNDRIWKRALLGDYKVGSDSFSAPQIKSVDLQLDNGARCMPDGFPCVVYLNGEFFGLFVWCLKKHRANYHMTKDTTTHVHLDGVLDYAHIFGANGVSSNIGWDPTSDNGFEVRNPKDDYLVTTEATKYDADAGTRQELAGVAVLGEAISTYDATYAYAKQSLCKVGKKIFMSKVDDNVGNNPSLASYGSKPKDVFKKATDYWIEVTFTNETKEAILRLSTYLPNIKAAATVEEKKALIEQYFDVENLIDYILVNMAVYDEDSFYKNWQWLTYDGIKWYASEYDKDCSFGNNWTGMFTTKVLENGGWVRHEGGNMETFDSPIRYVILYYKAEIKARWNELVTKGIFTKETFMSIVYDWISRFGAVNYEREFKRWPEAPCNRDNGVNSNWKVIDVYTGSASGTGDYDPEKTYEPGEVCIIKDPAASRWYFKFECVNENTGVYPFVQVSTDNPPYLGYRDSLWRLYNYIRENLENQNTFINSLN